jgi:hypothetical protein
MKQLIVIKINFNAANLLCCKSLIFRLYRTLLSDKAFAMPVRHDDRHQSYLVCRKYTQASSQYCNVQIKYLKFNLIGIQNGQKERERSV